MNPLLLTDSYKVTHWPQYPPGTSKIYSYFESRGGKWPQTVFFGLQYLLKRYLCGDVVRPKDLLEARELFGAHFSGQQMNVAGWDHLIKDHGGRFPVSIKAVQEGTVVPVSNVLMTIENTCPRCYWVTNYLETLLVQCWYPTTVATQSREIKKTILRYLERTGDVALIDFKLHDFGFRGVSSVESAGIGGCAHLVNFKGTDTLAALDVARHYYNEPCAGFSIPASEHSTITAWGEVHEVEAYANMLDKHPTGLVACVSDSFDIWRACSEYWGGLLREQVLARDGTLVIRPDSGYPPKVVLEVVQRLAAAFGATTNDKGYRVLDPHVRVIQGDGVTPETIEECLHQLQFAGFSADNVAFGMGGGLLQQVNRDTQQFAFKCSYMEASFGHGHYTRDIYKFPVGDIAKASKRGRLALVQNGFSGTLTTVREDEQGESDNVLREVFRDGLLLVESSLGEIRARAAIA